MIDNYSKYIHNQGEYGSCLVLLTKSRYIGTGILYDFNVGIGSGLGGAVYAGGLSIYICDSCEFTNNKAFQGGAVYITGDSRTEIRSSTFDSNTSSDNGSAF